MFVLKILVARGGYVIFTCKIIQDRGIHNHAWLSFVGEKCKMSMFANIYMYVLIHQFQRNSDYVHPFFTQILIPMVIVTFNMRGKSNLFILKTTRLVI